jgi:FtsP/CotA-like multicopper oxidase with cupredoxin domain
LLHIANGMYGAVIVDPAEGLPPAKEFVLVQSEFYAKGAADRKRNEADYPKMLADTPDFVVFNGMAQQYAQHPLQARPGEPLRIWVVNAGPSQPSAFHVVGAIFDRAYPDGNPANLLAGMQTVTIPPGGGAMVELTVPEEGLYPIVSHSFASATREHLRCCEWAIRQAHRSPRATEQWPPTRLGRGLPTPTTSSRTARRIVVAAPGPAGSFGHQLQERRWLLPTIAMEGVVNVDQGRK